jgi:signal transduction histidine kinase
MMELAGFRRSSLATRISIHVGLAAFVTTILQLTVVTAHNYFDYEDLSLAHVRRETQALLKGLTPGPSGLSFTLPDSVAYYRGRYRARYAFRVLDASGHVIAAQRPELLEKVSPSDQQNRTSTPSFWFRRLDDKHRFHFAGGQGYRIGNQVGLVEIATLGDPAGVHWRILAYESLEDVWLPILPFCFLIPMVTMFVVRRALNFLVRAARQAEAIDPGYPGQRLDLGYIPYEASAFAMAINRLLDRVRDLIWSKQIFMAKAAHQLRTPLAAMLLELEKIEDHRARGIERDVAGLSESVDRLLTLARLQATESRDFVPFNIGAVAEDAVRGLRGWATSRGNHIEIRSLETGEMCGDPVAVRDALVNLVENAVKHTPEGTTIRITAGPGFRVTVEDSGPGFPAEKSEHLFRPFQKGTSTMGGVGLGLAIVREAVELHGGSIEVGTSPLGGARFDLCFGSPAPSVEKE